MIGCYSIRIINTIRIFSHLASVFAFIEEKLPNVEYFLKVGVHLYSNYWVNQSNFLTLYSLTRSHLFNARYRMLKPFIEKIMDLFLLNLIFIKGHKLSVSFVLRKIMFRRILIVVSKNHFLNLRMLWFFSSVKLEKKFETSEQHWVASQQTAAFLNIIMLTNKSQLWTHLPISRVYRLKVRHSQK